MMKTDLVNGDDTDFFHFAGHKATFLGTGKAFSTFSFFLSSSASFIQQLMNESKPFFLANTKAKKNRGEKRVRQMSLAYLNLLL